MRGLSALFCGAFASACTLCGILYFGRGSIPMNPAPLTWIGVDRQYLGSRGDKAVARVSREALGWYVFNVSEPSDSIAHGPVLLRDEAKDWADKYL